MGIKSDLLNAQTKATKRGDTAEAERLGKLINQLTKIRGDRAAGLDVPAFAGPREFTVRKGDSPAAIAGRVFGDQSALALIAEFNPDFFKLDPTTGTFDFTAKQGDVLDLSFAFAPGLTPVDPRLLHAGFGNIHGPGGVPAPTPPTPGAPVSADVAAAEQVAGQLGPGGSFTPDQLAPPTPQGEDAFNAAFDVGTFPTSPVGTPTPTGQVTQQPATVGQQPTAPADLLEEVLAGEAARIGEAGGLDDLSQQAVQPGAVSVSGPAETQAAEVEGTAVAGGEARGQPFMGGILQPPGTTPDALTQFSTAMMATVEQLSLDPSNRSILPLEVPGEAAQFMAPAYGESEVSLMTTLGYYKEEGTGNWVRLPYGTRGGSVDFQGYGRTYRSGVSNSFNRHRWRNGRLVGPYVAGTGRQRRFQQRAFTPRFAQAPGRGFDSVGRSIPAIMWNVRFAERT